MTQMNDITVEQLYRMIDVLMDRYPRKNFIDNNEALLVYGNTTVIRTDNYQVYNRELTSDEVTLIWHRRGRNY